MYNEIDNFNCRDNIDLYFENLNDSYEHQRIDIYKQGANCETFYNCGKGKSLMSIVHAAILNDGIVMAADSRSSKEDNGSWSFDDNYDKLYYFADMGLGVVSAGLNEFGDKTFTDLCEEAQRCCSNQSINLDKRIDFVINELNNELSFYTQKTGVDCQIIYGFILKTPILNHIESTPKLISYIFSPKDDINANHIIKTGSSITFGVSWMQKYFVDSTIRNDITALEYKKKIEAEIKGLIEFSNRFENPSFVGGSVSSIIIK